MKKNMGNADRIIRLAAAIAVGVLYGLNMISGTVAIVLGVVAIAFFGDEPYWLVPNVPAVWPIDL